MSEKVKRITISLCVVLCLVLLATVVSPILEETIPAWKRFVQVVEENDIQPGALYYTNVQQTQEAEQHMRQAIKEAMEERRKARQQ